MGFIIKNSRFPSGETKGESKSAPPSEKNASCGAVHLPFTILDSNASYLPRLLLPAIQ